LSSQSHSAPVLDSLQQGTILAAVCTDYQYVFDSLFFMLLPRLSSSAAIRLTRLEHADIFVFVVLCRKVSPMHFGGFEDSMSMGRPRHLDRAATKSPRSYPTITSLVLCQRVALPCNQLHVYREHSFLAPAACLLSTGRARRGDASLSLDLTALPMPCFHTYKDSRLELANSRCTPWSSQNSVSRAYHSRDLKGIWGDLLGAA
jgi:hypothetical protein